MILESLIHKGVKDYLKLKREILLIYGYQNIFIFGDLENLGGLKEKEILKNLRKVLDISYSNINENLILIIINSNKTVVGDCSYLMVGFCTLGLRLIETAIEGKWSKIIDTLKKICGAVNYPTDESFFSNPTKDNNIIFVVFVGGLSFIDFFYKLIINTAIGVTQSNSYSINTYYPYLYFLFHSYGSGTVQFIFKT